MSLSNEAAILLELAEVTGQHVGAAMVARARAQWAEDDLNGYMDPRRSRWFFNLAGLQVIQPLAELELGVDPFA